MQALSIKPCHKQDALHPHVTRWPLDEPRRLTRYLIHELFTCAGGSSAGPSRAAAPCEHSGSEGCESNPLLSPGSEEAGLGAGKAAADAPVRKPLILKCGHRFCEPCISQCARSTFEPIFPLRPSCDIVSAALCHLSMQKQTINARKT